MGKNLFRKVFKDAKATLEEKQVNPKRDSIIGWDESKIEYVKRYKRENRQALLDYYVSERRCPICEEVKIESARWCIIAKRHLEKAKDHPQCLAVFEKYHKKVICRSCVKRLYYIMKGK